MMILLGEPTYPIEESWFSRKTKWFICQWWSSNDDRWFFILRCARSSIEKWWLLSWAWRFPWRVPFQVPDSVLEERICGRWIHKVWRLTLIDLSLKMLEIVPKMMNIVLKMMNICTVKGVRPLLPREVCTAEVPAGALSWRFCHVFIEFLSHFCVCFSSRSYLVVSSAIVRRDAVEGKHDGKMLIFLLKCSDFALEMLAFLIENVGFCRTTPLARPLCRWKTVSKMMEIAVKWWILYLIWWICINNDELCSARTTPQRPS